MDRQTKQIDVGGHTFVVKTYATARETQAIQGAYFKGTKIEIVGKEPKFSEFDPTVQYTAEHELLAQMVISIDGNTETIVERCLDLPSEVYEQLVGEVDALASKKKQ